MIFNRRNAEPDQQTPREDSLEQAEAAAAAETTAQAGPEAPEGAGGELDILKAELAAVRDQNLRLVAELRNQQQRYQRERAECLRYAEADFAKELLIVIDDLERALLAVRNGADAATVGDGVRITYEHFLKVLANHEIQPIEALGKPFDPHLHEAMLQQASEEYPAGTVMAEIARGYKMHDRVIRAARVVVSGGPAAATKSTT